MVYLQIALMIGIVATGVVAAHVIIGVVSFIYKKTVVWFKRVIRREAKKVKS